jgi:hypothetical protein
MTQEEWDSGTRSEEDKGSAELMGKLCQHMMALIWWKVGTDRALSEHMIWALEEWLCRQGLSIYMDLV